MPHQLYFNALTSAAHIALVAVGFSIIYRSVRCFHFAHAAVYTSSAYVAFAAVTLCRLPVWFAVCLGVTAASLLGAIIEIGVYRVLRTAKAPSLVLMLASLGVLVILQNTISAIFGDDTKAPFEANFGATLDIYGARITGAQVVLILASIVATAGLAVVDKTTRLGLIVRATGEDTPLAKAMGVNIEFAVLMPVLLGSALAGFAGILWGYNTAIHPQMGFIALLPAVVAALIGGVKSPNGVVLASLLIAGVQQVVIWKLPSHWQDVPIFVALIALMLMKPRNSSWQSTPAKRLVG